MELNRRQKGCVLLLTMLFCTTGCTPNDGKLPSELSAETELPPLVTTTSSTVATAETETSTLSVETEPSEPLLKAISTAWELPDELETLQAVRIHQGKVYLLGIQQDEENQQAKGVFFCASAEPEPIFTPLFTSANEVDFVGLVDFDVLSDGTICALLCENNNDVPYESPTFDPDTFDWETYYENYATQYRLVWYNTSGTVVQKLGLSTLLNLDETARQTMAFTGVRSDTSDHVYLTATIDEEECLMALDEQGNLTPIQGNGSNVLSLESDYQWIRSSTDGMLLWERETDETLTASHLVITDGALWKTKLSDAEYITNEMLLAENAEQDGWYSMWNQNGIYNVSEKNAAPELLYTWNDMHFDADEVENVLVLPEKKVLLTTHTAQGNLTIQLIEPETEEPIETQTTPSESDTNPRQDSPPVATPVNFS